MTVTPTRRPDSPDEAFGQVDAVRADLRGQSWIGADKKNKPASARDRGEATTGPGRIGRAKPAVDETRPWRQARRQPLKVSGAVRICKDEDARQIRCAPPGPLDRARRAPERAAGARRGIAIAIAP